MLSERNSYYVGIFIMLMSQYGGVTVDDVLTVMIDDVLTVTVSDH